MGENLLAQNKLIFIDTNILLDFYRIRGDGSSLSILDKINNNHDIIITGSQIEMEYKKNRQRAILESLGQLKSPDTGKLTEPAFIEKSKYVQAIKKRKDEIKKHTKNLTEKVEKILRNPSGNDDVYKSLQKLFKFKSDYNLSRTNKERFKIRRLARKRFVMGYPPRKKNDTSFGDAINWEWVIDCAIRSGRDIIIVSRDSDYGITYQSENTLNDWLRQEFKERVSPRKNIFLTDKLTKAFKEASVSVTKTEEKQEELLVKTPNYFVNIDQYTDLTKSETENMYNAFAKYVTEFNDKRKEK